MRTIINLKLAKMTFDEVMNLKDYVWKGNLLIPNEMIEGE